MLFLFLLSASFVVPEGRSKRTTRIVDIEFSVRLHSGEMGKHIDTGKNFITTAIINNRAEVYFIIGSKWHMSWVPSGTTALLVSNCFCHTTNTLLIFIINIRTSDIYSWNNKYFDYILCKLLLHYAVFFSVRFVLFSDESIFYSACLSCSISEIRLRWIAAWFVSLPWLNADHLNSNFMEWSGRKK